MSLSRVRNESRTSLAENQPSTSRGRYAEGLGDATETILKILQDVAKLVDEVPYMEGIAGILSTMIEIRQEMKDSEKYSQKVLDHILNLSKDILLQLKKLSELLGKDRLIQLQDDLKEYKEFLQDIVHNLHDYQSRHWLRRLTDRKSDQVKEWERKIDRFQQRFVNWRMVNIEMMIANSITNDIPRYYHCSIPLGPPIIPLPWPIILKPAAMFGREKELEVTLSHLRAHDPLCISILGIGGMGKTTLALHFAQRRGYTTVSKTAFHLL
ncbi:hypothetical protein M422DRAFT_258269 [Sphaerobolus stellatus SS14]|uniref:NB-ARC domain-containing protein n=1 Tax=Sphaerobolus stellatus (strain SS14) TaxID=990650 RepID=A0A0C9VC21_SPHS4|nr:hypothetical protein M422DRAFT_258269 [Sphaerobolus stellatus SS14]